MDYHGPEPVGPVASRCLPWSPAVPRLVSLCFGCLFDVGSLSPVVSRGSRRLPWSPVVSRPVVSRIVFAVSLRWAPVTPVAPVVSRRLPWSPVVSRLVSYCFGCFFTVGSRGSRGSRRLPWSPVVSRGLPFRLPWSPVVSRFASRGLPNCKPLIPVV